MLLRYSNYSLKHAIDVSQHVVIPETQHAIALCRQIGIALFVVKSFRVLAAIHFDNQAMFATNKVHNERTNGFLADEFQSSDLACAQSLPEVLFGVGGVFGGACGSVLFWSGLDRAFVSAPHPTCFASRPLPACGERLGQRKEQ
jgi:hypothetical protein